MKRCAFRISCCFLDPNHSICSLDDDLFGTRATDNMVRYLSARKTDKEGQSSDLIVDALFRSVLQLRLRRRVESHIMNKK